jgi:hypothetical protein
LAVVSLLPKEEEAKVDQNIDGLILKELKVKIWRRQVLEREFWTS